MFSRHEEDEVVVEVVMQVVVDEDVVGAQAGMAKDEEDEVVVVVDEDVVWADTARTWISMSTRNVSPSLRATWKSTMVRTAAQLRKHGRLLRSGSS